MTETDGLSQWVCRECAELVEEFVKFRRKYEETSRNLRLQIEQSFKEEEPPAVAEFEIEALDDAFEEVVKEEELSIEIVDYSDSNHKSENDEPKPLEPSADTKNSYNCDVCFKRYFHLNSLQRHIKTSHELYRHFCDICNMKFTQRSSLIEHMKNLHKNPIRSEVFICLADSSCQRTFNTAKMLTQHMKKHDEKLGRASNDDKKSPTGKSPKKKYRKQCQICGLFFKHIEEHKLTHQGTI